MHVAVTSPGNVHEQEGSLQVHGIASRKRSNGGRKTEAGSTHAVEELAFQREGSLHDGHEMVTE